VAVEEPEVRIDVELGLDIALAVGAAGVVMRSNSSMGGAGSCALPGPYISPRAQDMSSSKL
jgi:hypothetical protein